MRTEIAPKDLRELLVKILHKRGADGDSAGILAEEVVDSEMRGITSHGLLSFFQLLKYVQDGNQNEKMRIVRENDSLLIVDGLGNFGKVVVAALREKIIDKTRNSGVCVAIIKRIVPYLRPGNVAEFIGSNENITMVFHNSGQPMTCHPKGKKPLIGTNPIGIYIPTNADPVVVDMATSKKAWGSVDTARYFHEPLPSYTFLDTEGNITQDPHHILSVLPMGGIKGFSIGLFIEALCQHALNSSHFDEKCPWNSVILNFNIAKLGDKKLFLENFGRFLKSSKKDEHIRFPGERSSERKQKIIEVDRMNVDSDILSKLQGLL